MSGLFITGVGRASARRWSRRSSAINCERWAGRSRALKPVVSGFVEGDPDSDPALILRSLAIAPTREAIAAIAPWRFAAPLSPHLAARREGRSVIAARKSCGSAASERGRRDRSG